MTLSLNKPSAGDTNWTTPVNDNWTDLEEALDAISPAIQDCRLSADSSDPLGQTSGTPSATIYLHPHHGRKISLYDGSKWRLRDVATGGSSLAVTTGTASRVHDVFAYDASGSVTLELLAWAAGNTSRATALARQDGVLVKSSDATRRYLGTIYLNENSKVSDESQLRHIDNEFNRVPYHDYTHDSTESWSYDGSSGWRAMNNGDADWKHEYVIGRVRGGPQVTVEIHGLWADAGYAMGVGEDSTTPDSSKSAVSHANDAFLATCAALGASIGHHYAQCAETTTGASCTAYSDQGATIRAGMRVSRLR